LTCSDIDVYLEVISNYTATVCRKVISARPSDIDQRASDSTLAVL